MSQPSLINVLVTTFPGTDLPRTLSLPLPSTTPISALTSLISSYLPLSTSRLSLKTTSSHLVNPSSPLPLCSLLRPTPCDNHQRNAPQPQHLPSTTATLLPLQLLHALAGGKGGFGSQLRAAGGRMSSRKRNNNSTSDPNGSNRNLDGRRLRTVTEAKALAEYLAIKPEMEKREKEERRKRWEAVVAEAERREEEIRNGKAGRGARVDGKWVESKEEAGERTREAVLMAMKEGGLNARLTTATRTQSDGSEEASEESDSEGLEEARSSKSGIRASADKSKGASEPRTFFGWDEDDDQDMSASEVEIERDEEEPEVVGKGKGKAT